MEIAVDHFTNPPGRPDSMPWNSQQSGTIHNAHQRTSFDDADAASGIHAADGWPYSRWIHECGRIENQARSSPALWPRRSLVVVKYQASESVSAASAIRRGLLRLGIS